MHSRSNVDEVCYWSFYARRVLSARFQLLLGSLASTRSLLAARRLLLAGEMTTKTHFPTIECLLIAEEKDRSPKTGISGLAVWAIVVTDNNPCTHYNLTSASVAVRTSQWTRIQFDSVRIRYRRRCTPMISPGIENSLVVESWTVTVHHHSFQFQCLGRWLRELWERRSIVFMSDRAKAV